MESERDITEDWRDDADYDARAIGEACESCDTGVYEFKKGQQQTYDSEPISDRVICTYCGDERE